MVILTGLAAGALHVFSGPDHIAAVVPIAVDSPARAVKVGFRWGLGHGFGALMMGLLGIATRQLVDLHWLSAWAEFIVGFTLIAVGIWAFKKAMQIVVHTHGHDHDGDAHQHVHVHQGDKAVHAAHSHAAFGIGLLHGAAGTGHLLAVLPALALPTAQALAYLCAYFVSAVASMSGVGLVLARLLQHRGPLALRRMMLTSATASVGIGVAWLVLP